MKYLIIIIAIVILAGGFLWLRSGPKEMTYKKGDSIKNYKLIKDDGSEINTESFKGKWTVIYFYPKDDTPGCTKEAQTFTAMLDDFHKAKAEVYGLNTDTPESHRKFKEKYNLKVTLLSDPGKTTMDDFGVKIMAGFCARDSVLISPEGKYEAEFRGVSPSSHPAEILSYIIENSKQERP